MKITYDKVRDVAYFQILEIENDTGVVTHTEDVSDGVYVDYTADERVFGIEILDLSEKIPVKELLSAHKLKARYQARAG